MPPLCCNHNIWGKSMTRTTTHSETLRHSLGPCCLSLAAAFWLAIQPSGTAQAQSASADSAGGIEEIVVTATRRSESLSKVPISVTALSQDAMDERGIKDCQDIARFTPGVSVDNTG